MRIFVLLCAASLLSACATQKPMYHFGTYSSTLYAYKKDPTEEKKLKHIENIFKVIEKSEELEIRVPPGIYGELGYIFFKDGKHKEAIQYFNMEKRTYPESTVFMDGLISSARNMLEDMDEAESQPELTEGSSND